MEKICIVGGGNIGTAMAAKLSIHTDCQVIVHSSKKELWNTQIEVEDLQTGEVSLSGSIQVTDCIQTAVEGAKIVFVTHPSFLIPNTLQQMKPFLKEGVWVGVVPGTGGAEFYVRELIDMGCVFFGVDRVPCISRVKEVGKRVASSFKTQIRVAAIPSRYTDVICEKLSFLFGMECGSIKNYLSVTLTPFNPILHTARLYSMFAAREITHVYERQFLFYKEWTDDASRLMMDCDRELQCICKKLPELELEVIPLTIHYESETVEAMTRKLGSIKTLSKILAPMKSVDGGYVVDLESRYFTEDIPYGLCILKGFAVLTGVDTPNMDLILRWYEQIQQQEYFVGDEFVGKDLLHSAVPQNFGIRTKADLLEFYKL